MPTQHSNRFRIATHLNALWCWLMAKPGQPGQVTASRMAASADMPTHPQHTQPTPTDTACTSMHPAARQPLRVLRVMDTDLAPAQIGRLRISGRMADVCAELDRLAAHESMLH